MKVRWMVIVLAGVLLTAVACGDDDGGDVGDSAGTPAATVTQDEDAEAHDEGDEHDAEAHDEGEESDAEAFAYLEAAPKDRLFLMEMSDFAFTPDVVEVNVGEVVEIAIQNPEALEHDFTIDKIDADLHISYLAGTGEHAHAEAHPTADLHFVLNEVGSGIVHIKVNEPGEYVFYCSVPGHREAGMEGMLIVNG